MAHEPRRRLAKHASFAMRFADNSSAQLPDAGYHFNGGRTRAQLRGRRPNISRGSGVASQIAKLMLHVANTVSDRQEAVRTAISLGIPLHEIEEYLDHLDNFPRQSTPHSRKVDVQE